MRPTVIHRRSVGLDSIASSGAPPPGYTSQRDTTSFVAMNNDDEEEEEEDAKFNNSLAPPPPPPLMDSPYRDAAFYNLPSPYSVEDLVTTQPVVEEAHQDSPHRSPTQSYTGYTHTQSQCTLVSPSRSHSNPVQCSSLPTNIPSVRSSSYHHCDPPHACNLYNPSHIFSTDDLFAENGQPRPATRPYNRSSTDEHWQPPVQADNHQQKLTPPYTNLSSSPYYHHHQNTCPPPIRILSYPSTNDHGYDHEEYNNGEGEGNRRTMTTMMNSTATILSPPEESGYYQGHDPALPPHAPHPDRRRRPSLPNGPATSPATCDVTGINPAPNKLKSKNPTKKSESSTPPPPPPQSQTKPTNYVHISRKCSPSIPTSKSWGWRRKTVVQSTTQIPPPRLSPSSSAVTGTFVIDPELHIPHSLLNAMEDPVFRSFSSSFDTTPGDTTASMSTTTNNKSRRTNLKLEIENGGIDVDIRLVPTTTATTTINNGRDTCNVVGNRDTFCDTTPIQAQVSGSASTITFSHGGPQALPTEAYDKRQLQRLSIATTVGQTSPTRRNKNLKKPNGPPTTIDLRIKQTHHHHQDTELNQTQDLVKIDGPPLIARIHAPNPRPPFHLFASTIDINITPTQVPNTREKETQPRVSTSLSHAPTNTVLNNQIASFEPTLVMNSLPSLPPPPAPLPRRRRTKRSLSKSRPAKRPVYSSHGHGVTSTPTTPSLHTPSSSLSTASTRTSNTTQSIYASPSSPTLPSSSSPLHLHLPRTFRGPLTIHISSGNISDHLRLSEKLEREVALIRETEFGRGYFVGGLSSDSVGDDGDDVNDDGYVDLGRRVIREGPGGERGGDGDANLIHPTEKSVNNLHNRPLPNIEKAFIGKHEPSESRSSSVPSSVAPSSSASSSLSSPDKEVKEEWYGDRIEILVGCGDVYLQFEDEDEDEDWMRMRTRKEVGFWKRFTKFLS